MSIGPGGRLNATSAAIAACLGLAASTPALAQQAVQWRTQDGGNGHWYAAFDATGQSHLTHSMASAMAFERGSHLVTFASQEELQAVLSLLTPAAVHSAWIGLVQQPGSTEPSGGWRWITGEPMDFTFWDSGQPDNRGCNQPNAPQNHGRLNGSGPRWDDHGDPVPSCPSAINRAIFEWSADCDGNGVVDYGEILDGTLADTNANGVPDCCDAGVSCDPCPGDLNASGTVDAEDLAYVLFAWGTDGGKAGGADINGDATVDANDLSLVLGSWGPCPE